MAGTGGGKQDQGLVNTKHKNPRAATGKTERMGWERKRGGATSADDEGSNTEEHPPDSLSTTWGDRDNQEGKPEGAHCARKMSVVLSELSCSSSEGDNDVNDHDHNHDHYDRDDDIGHVGDDWETNLRYSTTWRGKGAFLLPRPTGRSCRSRCHALPSPAIKMPCLTFS